MWPSPLQPDFYYEAAVGVRSVADARVVAGMLLVLLALGGLVAAALRIAPRAARGEIAPASRTAAASLGAAWTLAFLLPVSHLLDFGALMAGALALGLVGAAFGGAAPAAARWPLALAALACAWLRLRKRPAPDLSLALASGEGDLTAASAGALSAEVQADPASEVVQPEPTIGRELRAVAVLYAVLCVLPWLAGAAFGP